MEEIEGERGGEERKGGKMKSDEKSQLDLNYEKLTRVKFLSRLIVNFPLNFTKGN